MKPLYVGIIGYQGNLTSGFTRAPPVGAQAVLCGSMIALVRSFYKCRSVALIPRLSFLPTRDYDCAGMASQLALYIEFGNDL